MTMTVLGSGFQQPDPGGPSPEELLRADLVTDVLALVQDSLLSTLVDRLTGFQIDVPAPVINVDSPVHVASPASPAIPGIEEMAAQLAALNANLSTLISLLSQPVRRTVTRNSAGVIESMTETRA